MKQFSFTLITVLFIGILGYGGYLAVASLKDPKTYVSDSREKIGDLHRVATSTDDASDKSMHEPVPTLKEATAPAVVETTQQTPAPTAAASESTLKTRLEKLIAQNLVLKNGSKGEYVGTIQLFMNQFYNKQSKIDNDFGKNLEADVKKFQAAHKISATGQVGPQTQKKMLELAK